jgi:hypothetical protein
MRLQYPLAVVLVTLTATTALAFQPNKDCWGSVMPQHLEVNLKAFAVGRECAEL